VDKPLGQNEWGLNCVVLERLPSGTPVQMLCWVSTYEPAKGQSAKWFSVTIGAGPGVRAEAVGETAWVWSDYVSQPQPKVGACDHIGHEKDPAPTYPPPPPDLVFAIHGSCTTAGGTLTSTSSGFTPGGLLDISATYPNGKPYTNLTASGTVKKDGTITWRWPCQGDPAGTYSTQIVDRETARYVTASFTIDSAPTSSQPPSGNPPPAPTAKPAPPAPKPSAPPAPGPAPAPQHAVVVWDKVTNGATEMREDTPAYLSTVTHNYCKRDGCNLTGTDARTGTSLIAICQTTGDRTTNGQDNSTVDDSNPGLYSSSLWYKIRWSDGRLGYISEVWLEPTSRGGLGLPGC
jgi:hypothetical protein